MWGPLLLYPRLHPDVPHLSRCLLRADTNIVTRGWTCSLSRWPVRTSQFSKFPSPDIHLGLNFRLSKSQSRTSVVAFIIMPAPTHSYTVDALKGQAVTKQLRDTVTEIQNRIGARLFDHAIRSNGFVDLCSHPTMTYFLSAQRTRYIAESRPTSDRRRQRSFEASYTGSEKEHSSANHHAQYG